ncbi:MAG: AbrB/MazE/SpoVT family DNA-binding domain-containing protein [Chloroflexi bacterium]|nr:AbrB/MazE/SpoVT family DNA-binding domain-containing protein [Chloroflexota bacterium]
MKEITTRLTQRSQVTVPAEVLRLLGLKPRDQVVFAIENGKVRIAPARFTLESAYCSVKPSRKPEDLEALIREAKEAKAEETLRELAQS